jgi:predicted outer membrane lipoprotein
MLPSPAEVALPTLCATTSPILPGGGVLLLGVTLAALAATAAPLLTYTLTLAVFGGAHVLCELRFVEARFAARLAARLRWGIGALLAVIVVLRLLRALGVWGGADSVTVELIGVVGLAALTLPALATAGALPLLLGIAVVGLVGVGLLADPILTILALACLHNWTPLGFLAEGLPGPERRRGLAVAAVVLGAVPLLIATGLPGRLIGSAWRELTVLPTGGLSDNLGAYIPGIFQHTDWAVPAFSAFVFAQCMHYAAVIGVLPRIAPGGPGAAAVVGLSSIPRSAWLLGVTLASAIGFIGYTLDFTEARSWYAIIAAVHAWVEVPVLLLALVPGLHVVTRPATD